MTGSPNDIDRLIMETRGFIGRAEEILDVSRDPTGTDRLVARLVILNEVIRDLDKVEIEDHDMKEIVDAWTSNAFKTLALLTMGIACLSKTDRRKVRE